MTLTREISHPSNSHSLTVIFDAVEVFSWDDFGTRHSDFVCVKVIEVAPEYSEDGTETYPDWAWDCDYVNMMI